MGERPVHLFAVIAIDQKQRCTHGHSIERIDALACRDDEAAFGIGDVFRRGPGRVIGPGSWFYGAGDPRHRIGSDDLGFGAVDKFVFEPVQFAAGAHLSKTALDLVQQVFFCNLEGLAIDAEIFRTRAPAKGEGERGQ